MKYEIPLIRSITQDTILLYYTMIRNEDKYNNKPEVYQKCNVWQTGYAIPVLVMM